MNTQSNIITRLIIFIIMLHVAAFALACSDQDSEKKHYEKGVSYVEDDESAKAIHEFKEVVRINPKNADAYLNLGHEYLKLDKPDFSIKNLNKAIELKTSDALTAHYLLALAYQAIGELDTALSNLDILNKEKPNDPGLLDFIGSIYAQKEDYLKAKEHFTMALQIDPAFIPSLINIGKLFQMENKFQDARKEFERASKIDPNDISALYAMAELLSIEKRYNEAIQKYLEILKIAPDEFMARGFLSYLYLYRGNYEKMKEQAMEIKRRWPENPAASFFNGMALMNQNNINEAVSELQVAQENWFFLPDVYYLLSMRNFKKKYTQLAISEAVKVNDYDSGITMVNIFLAAMYLNQQWYDEAIWEIKKVLEVFPRNMLARKVSGYAYILKGEYDRGFQELSDTIEFDPEFSDRYLGIGMDAILHGTEIDKTGTDKNDPGDKEARIRLILTLIDGKKLNEAIRECKNGLRIKPQDEIMHILLGIAHLKNNNSKLMFESLEKALEMNPGLTSPHFIIASYYLKRKEREKTLEQYWAVLKKNPKDTRARIAIARIMEDEGKINKALQFYKEATKGENAVEALTSLGMVYLKNKDYERTILVAQEALKLNSKASKGYILLGSAYSAKKDMQKAIEYFSKLQELNSFVSLRHYDLDRFNAPQL